jgi:hypothetical protein
MLFASIDSYLHKPTPTDPNLIPYYSLLDLMLPDRSWRISYSSNENNPIAKFYIPTLECAAQYERKSGFFIGRDN